MKIDGMVHGTFEEIAAQARRLEADGYDGAATAETGHDPFLPLAAAAGVTTKLELGTSIAVAFARTPMTLAATANDLHFATNGRFTLGLGSQIKPHIEKRFSMPWSHPAPRMREFILALRAIWHSWNTGEKLDFRGEFYTHTLMTPFFSPGPNPHGTPKAHPSKKPTPPTATKPEPPKATKPKAPKPKPKPAPKPKPTPASSAPSNCTPGYDPCVPYASDVDCAGGSGNGPVYVEGPIRVTGDDPYGLDADGDGWGCES